MTPNKATIRARIQDRRRNLDASALAGAADRFTAALIELAEERGVRTLCAYVPMGSEPGSEAMLERLRGSGRAVQLPICRADNGLDWAPYEGGAQLAPGPFGTREPTGRRLGAGELARVDLIVVPAMAADRAGHRLGRGGGFYDRALAGLPEPIPVLALVYDEDVIDAVPVQDHDRPVDAVLTPSGVIVADADRWNRSRRSS